MVSGCAELDWPTPTTDANVSCDGLDPSPVASWPEPLSWMEAAATPAVDEVTASKAAIAPVADGVKMTWTVQIAPLLRSAPQVVTPSE